MFRLRLILQETDIKSCGQAIKPTWGPRSSRLRIFPVSHTLPFTETGITGNYTLHMLHGTQTLIMTSMSWGFCSTVVSLNRRFGSMPRWGDKHLLPCDCSDFLSNVALIDLLIPWNEAVSLSYVKKNNPESACRRSDSTLHRFTWECVRIQIILVAYVFISDKQSLV